MTYRETLSIPAAGDDRPRVLHLITWLPRGGIETWLSHVFAHSGSSSPVRHEVLLMKQEKGPLAPKIEAAGVRIHTLPMRNKALWFLQLYRFLRKHGPFDIFHAHTDAIVTGPAMVTAKAAGVPVRIAHNHAARLLGVDYRGLSNRMREMIGTRLSAQAATTRIAISEMAMVQLAGSDWRRDRRCRILLYGFDYTQFYDAERRVATLRDRHALAQHAPIIGHIGRFDSQKNHSFLLAAFAEYLELNPAAKLILIGRGAFQAALETQVRELGIDDSVIFAGGTDDVAAYLKLFDVFAFPSFSEGLGIVILEAQAAGTPVLMPENMPREVIVYPPCITELPLAAGAAAWAQTMSLLTAAPRPDPVAALTAVESSAFGMQRCMDDLHAIYAQELQTFASGPRWAGELGNHADALT